MEGGDRRVIRLPPGLSEKAEKLVTPLGVQVMKGVNGHLQSTTLASPTNAATPPKSSPRKRSSGRAVS